MPDTNSRNEHAASFLNHTTRMIHIPGTDIDGSGGRTKRDGITGSGSNAETVRPMITHALMKRLIPASWTLSNPVARRARSKNPGFTLPPLLRWCDRSFSVVHLTRESEKVERQENKSLCPILESEAKIWRLFNYALAF